jgi:hypothetical protein
MKKEWKIIDGFEGYYKISNQGEVYSIRSKRLIKIHNNMDGYPCINIYDKTSKRKLTYKSVHRLVAMAFIPNPENYSDVNHKDGIKTNNKVNNLEWCTRKYNRNHAIKTGLARFATGEKNTFAKLKEKEVLLIRENKDNLNLTELTEKFKVHRDTIYLIIKRKTWKHI